jgi:hypothetical protein
MSSSSGTGLRGGFFASPARSQGPACSSSSGGCAVEFQLEMLQEQADRHDIVSIQEHCQILTQTVFRRNLDICNAHTTK